MTPDARTSLPPGRVFGLDLLRAVAILLVMVAHSRPNALFGTHWAEWFDGLGTPGVELFFALSGFLIGSILLRDLAGPTATGPREILQFWKRRWYRTLPNYYLFLVVHVVLAWGRQDPSLTVAAVLPHLLFLQNLVHAPPGFFFGSWTLAIEEWSYLLLPPLLWIGRRAGLPGPRAAVAGLLILGLGSLTARLLAPADLDWSLAVQKAVVRRLDALLFGVGAAWVARYRPGWWTQATWLALPGALAFAGLAVLGVRWGNFSGTPAWVRILYPTAVGLAGASLLPWASHLSTGPRLLGPTIRWISLISYSLYLVHVPLRVVLYQVCFVKLHLPTNWTGEAVFQVVCWTAYLTAGTCLYYGFERPLMNLRDRWR